MQPSAVRYIKLGPSGAWFERCVREGLIEFGHSSVPHEVALRRDRGELERLLQSQGRSPAKAKDFAREILDFYGLGEDALWITIAAGRLWWAFFSGVGRRAHQEGGFTFVFGEAEVEVDRSAGRLQNRLTYTAVYRDGPGPRFFAWHAVKALGPSR